MSSGSRFGESSPLPTVKAAASKRCGLYEQSGIDYEMIPRHAIVLPVVVEFTICEDRPLVFIKGVRLM